jgi:hypothetical protein
VFSPFIVHVSASRSSLEEQHQIFCLDGVVGAGEVVCLLEKKINHVSMGLQGCCSVVWAFLARLLFYFSWVYTVTCLKKLVELNVK